MAASMIIPAYYIGVSFGYGFKNGYDNPDASYEEITSTSPYDLAFIYEPEKYSNLPDTLVTEDGRQFPMIITRATVIIPENNKTNALEWVTTICYCLVFALFICFIIEFVLFIININKGRIFVKKNVSRLRRIAWYLISLAILRCAGGFTDDYLLSCIPIKLESYTLSTYWTLPWSELIIGLIALLMAEIWARGLKMREEQELTI